jgi:peptidoglycan/LPS O-acetylase OafA/YrhL
MQREKFDTAVPAYRHYGLDLVRAAAIILVMAYHANTMMLANTTSPSLLSFGWMGVDLFFVLSGFLIGGQLLKPWSLGSRPNYTRFFARRAFRTIPAFALVLGLYFAFPKLRETPDIQPLWQFATFTENLLFQPTGPKAFDQAWSLCAEEQFYVLFPLVLMIVASKPSTKKTVSFLVTILVGGLLLRSFLWLAFVANKPFDMNSGSNWRPYVSLIYYPTWSRLDGLLAGVALATLKTFRGPSWLKFVARPDLLFAGGVAGISLAISSFAGAVPPILSVAIGFPLLAASGALIVAAASTGRGLIGKCRLPGIQALAAGAYSLYLTHKIAYHLVRTDIGPALGATGNEQLAIAIVVALFTGTALYWAVERPFLILRDRWDDSARTWSRSRTLVPGPGVARYRPSSSNETGLSAEAT